MLSITPLDLTSWVRTRRGDLPHRAARAIAIAGACAAAFSVAAPVPAMAAARAHAAVACTSIDFIGARGSGEKITDGAGFGAEVDAMYKELNAKLPGVKATPVEDGYIAAPVDELFPSGAEAVLARVNLPAAVIDWERNHLQAYLASIQSGIVATLAYVQAEVSRCPSTAIVLAGYSQGAMAIHQAEIQMSAAVRAHIAGTILLGDGDRTPNTRAAETLGTSPAGGEGIRTYLGMNSGRDVPIPQSTVDICNIHDIVCDFTSGAILHYQADSRVHTTYMSYMNGGLMKQAADWIVSLYQAHHPAPTSVGAPGPGAPAPGPGGPPLGDGGLTIGGLPPGAFVETTGGTANTWSDYTNAGGSAGPQIPAYTSVGVTCKITGFQVADGNTWWYQVASSPWNGVYYVSADAFYNDGGTSGSLVGTPFVDLAVPTCGTPPPLSVEPAGVAETTGGVAHTWTDYGDAGGTQGPDVAANQTVQITCAVAGFQVADGNTWWYEIASSPWNDAYYVSADAFYNDGATSGSLIGTPFVDPAVPQCAGNQQPPSAPGSVAETAGGVTHTWTNPANAGGTQGPSIASNQTVQIACKVQGFQVADGNTWWYEIASSPWSGAYYASADAFYNNGQVSGSLIGTPFVDNSVPDCSVAPVAPPAPQQPPPPPAPTFAETVGGVTHTWTNYSNAGGTQGPSIASNQTVQIACKVQGFTVADGDTWWYRVASSPWNGSYYASADAFYNNGQTSGSLHGTPFVDNSVPDC